MDNTIEQTFEKHDNDDNTMQREVPQQVENKLITPPAKRRDITDADSSDLIMAPRNQENASVPEENSAKLSRDLFVEAAGKIRNENGNKLLLEVENDMILSPPANRRCEADMFSSDLIMAPRKPRRSPTPMENLGQFGRVLFPEETDETKGDITTKWTNFSFSEEEDEAYIAILESLFDSSNSDEEGQLEDMSPTRTAEQLSNTLNIFEEILDMMDETIAAWKKKLAGTGNRAEVLRDIERDGKEEERQVSNDRISPVSPSMID